MTAAHIHLISVHLPVVGVLFALAVLVIALLSGRDLLLKLAYGTLLFSAAVAAVAYYSGPAAYDALQQALRGDEHWVEQHAAVGRAFFFALVLAAIAALQALLQFAQGEPPPRWLRGLIMALALLCCYLGAWSAHLGGAIRHEQVREPEWLLLPHLHDVASEDVENEPTEENPGA